MKPLHLAMRALASALFVVLAFAALADASLSKVAVTGDPGAVCTDGSAAAYYWKPAPVVAAPAALRLNATTSRPAAANVWIIYLQGGGWCYDDASCKARCGDPTAFPTTGKPLCGSSSYASSKALGGIFYPEDATLRDANKVFVPYCTSDGHMGDAKTEGGFSFRGARVVQAILRDLVENKGLGGKKGSGGGARDTVIFGGGSAGGRGAMVHLDYVPTMLGPAAAANVDVVGFLDSPFWIDEAPFAGRTDSSFPGFNVTTKGVFAQANVSHLGKQCAKDYPGAEAWKCLFGQYRMPSIETPYVLVVVA